jgi:predicted nucleotidyltransferase
MDKNINLIKKLISDFFPDSRVIIFGSRATGTFSDLSDYDVLVIVNEKISISDKLKFQSKIRKGLADFLIPVDIFIESRDEIVGKSQLTNHIVNEALNKGVEV